MKKIFLIALILILSTSGVSYALDNSARDNPHWAECSNKCGRCDYSAENPCTEKHLRCINACIAEKEEIDRQNKQELDTKIVVSIFAFVSLAIVVPAALYIVKRIERKQEARERGSIDIKK